MNIVIQPPETVDRAYAVHNELQKAFDVLLSALIPLDGARSVVNDAPIHGVLFLRYRRDRARALALLRQAGIRAFLQQKPRVLKATAQNLHEEKARVA